jgi:chaperonin GroEL
MTHENPFILVTDHKISMVEDILPILEMIARESRPLIIVAEEIEGQALAALIMNSVRGTLKVAAIKAPYYGDERRNTLEDLSISTGATFISRESGLKLSDTRMEYLGSASSIESNKYKTVIVGGSCDAEALESKIESLKNEIKQTDSLSVCEKIQSRIVRLSSGVAVIHVGGTTEVEMIERKHRIEDALEAVRSAQEGGIVAGGGTALLRASRTLVITTDSSEKALGATIIKAACEEPIRQMALNSGESPDLIIQTVAGQDSTTCGWNFLTNECADLLQDGVIDPVKVTETALQNAASCAGTLITTNYGIIQTEAD